jgi:hypothetical protein
MKCADLDVLDDVLDDTQGNSEFSEEQKNQVSSCRYCAHYAHEGRRGGTCDSLNVDVQGSWKACPLAVSAFSESVLPEPVLPEPVLVELGVSAPICMDALPYWMSRLQTHYNYAES